MNRIRLIILAVLAMTVLLGLASTVRAQYPTRPITLIVSAGVGGNTDTGARLLAKELEGTLKQPVVVVNKPAASGRVAIQDTIAARADGYTLLYSGSATVTHEFLFKDLPYDVYRDLTPISMTTDNFTFFASSATIPAKTLAEFVAYVKRNPGKVNYGSLGKTANMMSIESFKGMAGIEMTEIPYSGSPPLIAGLLRGDVHFASNTLDVLKGHVDTGKVVLLAWGGPRRTQLAPDVPTVAESGYPTFDAPGWHGVFAPKNLPDDIVAKLQEAIAAAMKVPAVRARLESIGSIAIGSTAQEMRERMERDRKLWSGIAKSLNLQPD